jgi:type I restriction enzyme R subunit
LPPQNHCFLDWQNPDAVARINPTIPDDAQQEAIKEISRIHSPELLTNNETFHRMLTEGVKVSYQKEGSQRGDLVWLVDFANPENNDFVVANQLTVIENGVNKRPDVVLFVNGLPLVVIELKNAADENASVKSAYKQLQTYKASIPSLFTCWFATTKSLFSGLAKSTSQTKSPRWLPSF